MKEGYIFVNDVKLLLRFVLWLIRVVRSDFADFYYSNYSELETGEKQTKLVKIVNVSHSADKESSLV